MHLEALGHAGATLRSQKVKAYIPSFYFKGFCLQRWTPFETQKISLGASRRASELPMVCFGMIFSGPFFDSELGTLPFGQILRARVVIGAIVGAQGALECLKAGGSCERLFQGGLRNKDWGGGGTLKVGLMGAQLPPPHLPHQYREGMKESRSIH